MYPDPRQNFHRNNNQNNNNNSQVNNSSKAESGQQSESEVLGLTKALGRALKKAVVNGSKSVLAEAIASGINDGAKELSERLDKSMVALTEGIANNLKEISVAQPAAPVLADTANMVSGEEYEKLESMLRQKEERLAEVRRQALTAEAEVQRLKSVLDTKELAIQEKLTMLSKANAENKDLKLQMVDLEGKVRIMRKESENTAAAIKLATTEKQDALNERDVLKGQLDEIAKKNEGLAAQLNQLKADLAKAAAAAPAPAVKVAKVPKAAKDFKSEKAAKEVKMAENKPAKEKAAAAPKDKAAAAKKSPAKKKTVKE